MSKGASRDLNSEEKEIKVHDECSCVQGSCRKLITFFQDNLKWKEQDLGINWPKNSKALSPLRILI